MPKLTIVGLSETIVKLQEAYDIKSAEASEAKESFGDFVKNLASILGVEGRGHNNPTAGDVTVALHKLIRSKDQIEKDLEAIEGRIDERVKYTDIENSRVWYLLRALAQDPTLEPAVEENYMEGTRRQIRPFNGPGFHSGR